MMSHRPEGMPMGPGPGGPGPEPRVEQLQRALHHLREAVGALHAAGIHELAEKLAQEAQRLEREARPAVEKEEILRIVHKLGEEIERLHNEMNELRRRIDERR